MKRIIALAGVILLVLMYIAFFIFAFIFPENAMEMFICAAAVTVIVPIFLWILIWCVGAITGRHTIASLDALSSDKEHDKYGNVIEDNDKIDTIILDMGNVLVDFCWDDMLIEKGLPKDKVDRFGKATIFSSDWKEFDLGNLSKEEIIDLFVKNDPEMEDDFRKYLSDMKGIVKLRNYTIPFIEGLKKARYKVLVLSNFSKYIIDDNPDDMRYLSLFDGGIISYKDHVIKPNADIYKLLIDRYNLNPKNCIFIDDMKENIDAARKFGINTILFKNIDDTLEELKEYGVKLLK